MENTFQWMNLKKLYERSFGFGRAQIQPGSLARADIPMLYCTFPSARQNALIRGEQNDLAFNYIQFLLAGRKRSLDIRDRGLVLAQMDAYPSAIESLEYFVDQCPNDPLLLCSKTQLLELER